jgi:hypothetical protein
VNACPHYCHGSENQIFRAGDWWAAQPAGLTTPDDDPQGRSDEANRYVSRLVQRTWPAPALLSVPQKPKALIRVFRSPDIPTLTTIPPPCIHHICDKPDAYQTPGGLCLPPMECKSICPSADFAWCSPQTRIPCTDRRLLGLVPQALNHSFEMEILHFRSVCQRPELPFPGRPSL